MSGDGQKEAKTTEKKIATTVKKMTQGFGYKYSDLSTIHEELEKQRITYYQYVEYDANAGMDYIWTVLVVNGEELKPRRGCRIVVGDEMRTLAQAQGSGITYARRYSLLMALGWATEDDDGDGVGKKSATVPTTAPAEAKQDRPAYANRVDFRQVREHLGEIKTVSELNQYWVSLHLSEKQAAILKSDFAERKTHIGLEEVGLG